MLATFHDDEVEFRVEDADARERVLLCVFGDLEAVAAVGEGVELVDGDVDAPCSVGGLLGGEFLGALLLGEFAVFVHLLVLLGTLFDLGGDAGFDGGGVEGGFLTEDAHEVALFDFGGRGGLEAKADFGLLFFKVGHAALAAEFGLFLRGEEHRFGGGYVLFLRGLEGHGVLDVESYDGVGGVNFEAVGVVEGGVVFAGDETFVPPFDLGRGRDKEGLFCVEIFIYAGFTGGFGDAAFHGFEGGLTPHGCCLLDIFPLLIEHELTRDARLECGSFGTESRVKVGIAACLLGGRSGEVELFLAFGRFGGSPW